jgi:hypothetical protein
MPRINISEALIKMDATEGGAVNDYSNEIMRATLDTTRTNSRHYTFGSGSGLVTVGKIGGTLTLTVEGNTGASSLLGVLNTMMTDTSPNTRSFEVYLPNATASSGSQKYTFEAHIVSLQMANADAGGNGVSMHEATFEVDGAITFTNVT